MKHRNKSRKHFSRLFKPETVYEQACKEIVEVGKFDFSALQTCHRSEQVIETVWAHGTAKHWEGRAKHYLEKDERVCDIEADIALATPPRVEIIYGNDQRYNEWIVTTYRSQMLASVFVPLILARDGDGNVLEGNALNAWLATWEFVADQERTVAGRRVFQVKIPEAKISWISIGTIEAGFNDFTKQIITDATAFETAKVAAQIAVRVHHTQLDHVFQTVVKHAHRLGGAMYASLHFDGSAEPVDGQHIGYVYQVFSGRVAKGFLTDHPPRVDGIGARAIVQQEIAD